MLALRALNTTKNPVNFCSTYLSPVPNRFTEATLFVPFWLGLTKENESRKLLALKYFKEKVLSLGRAAEFSGLLKWDFIEYLSDNDVPVVDYDTTPLPAPMLEEKEPILDIIFRPNCQK